MAIVGTAYVQIRAVTNKINDDIQRSLNGNQGAFENAGRQYSAAIQRGMREGAVDLSGFVPDIDPSGFEASLDRIRNSTSETRRTTERETSRIEAAFLRAGANSGRNFIQKFGESNISSYMRRLFYIILFGIPAVGALVGALSSLVSGLFALGSAVAPAVNSLAVLPGILSAVAAGVLSVGIGFKGVGDAFRAGTQQISGGAGRAAAAAKQTVKTVAVAFRSVPSEPFKINWELPEQRAVRDTYEQTAEAIKNAVRGVQTAEFNLADALKSSQSAQQAVNQARADAINQLIELGFAAEQASISEGKAAIALERAQEKYAEVSDLPPNHRLRREAELNLRQAQLDLEEAVKKNQDTAQEQAEAAEKGVEGSDEVVEARERETQATRDLAEAQAALVEAQEDLEKAQRGAAEQNADALKNAADAAQKMGEALGGAGGGVDRFAQAMAKLSPQAQAFVKYLLSVRDSFKAVRDEAGVELFPKLTTAIQTLIGGGFLGTFASMLRAAGSAVGDIAIRLANLTTNSFFTGNFKSVSESNVVVLDAMGKVLENIVQLFFAVAAAARPVTERFAEWAVTLTGGWLASAQGDMEGLSAKIQRGADVVAQLADIFGLLWDNIKLIGQASQESGQSLLDSFEAALTKLREFLSTPEQQQTMKQYFADVADNVRAIGDLFNALAVEFIKLGDNKVIAEIAQQFSALAPEIGELLSGSLDSVGPAMADLVSELVHLFQTLTSNGALKEFIEILASAARTLNDLASSPIFGDLIGRLAVLFAAWKAFSLLANVFNIGPLISGMSTIVTSSKAVIDGMRGVVSASGAAHSSLWRFGQMLGSGVKAMKSFIVTSAQTVAALARQAAAWAVNTARTIAATAASIASAAAQKVVRAATIAYTAVQWLLNAAMTANPIGLIIAGIVALVAAFVWLWNNVEGFRNFFLSAWEWIQNAIAAVVDWVKANWPLLLAIITGPIGLAVKFVIDHWEEIKDGVAAAINWVKNTVETVLNGLVVIWNAIWNGISAAAQAVWNGIVAAVTWYFNLIRSIIVNIITGLQAIWASIWGGIRSTAESVWNGIVGFFSGAVDSLGRTFGKIADAISGPFKTAFNSIADFWNRTIGNLSWTVPSWVPVIGGNTISAPKLPKLADGGIIKATAGGVAAIMGEAGQDERVTPLGADGLSAGERQIRDAILSMTAVPRTVQITVVAAPGMDISALSKEVARELAFSS